MKATVATDTLKATVRLAARAIPSKSPLPILGNLRIDANHQGTLDVAATDLETHLTVSCAARVTADDAALVVPGALLAGWLDTFAGGEVTLDQAGTKLRAKCGGSTAQLATSDIEDFPVWPVLGEAWLTLPASALQAAVAAVVPAAATDETRPVLAAVQIAVQNGALTLAAADGFRLMTSTIAGEAAAGEALVPLRVLKLLLAALAGEKPETPVGLHLSANVIGFKTERFTLTGRRVEGQFPDWRRIVPQTGTAVTLPADDLLAALRSCSPFARSNSRIVRVSGDDDTLTLAARDMDGASDVVATLEAAVPSAVSFAVNGGYFADALAPFAGTVVSISNSGPTSPIKLTADGSPHLAVLMPMHTEAPR